MKHAALLLALVPLALLLGNATSAGTETYYDGRVVEVIDGDTLEVWVEGAPPEKLRIRLSGIDTPERDQPWGQRAREALAARVADALVRINGITTDRYGRVVGEVYAGDVCVSCELVREGHAWVYRRYTDDAVLIGLEEDAREHRRGLWSLPEAERIAPWDWRRGVRSSPNAGRADTDLPGSDRSQDQLAGCGEKRSCREMASCDEARFHLTECGRSQLDGDGDGTPCEKLCR